MICPTLRLAAMAILGAMFAASPARAQNLEAGKPPGQIFSNTCNACHKSARGLLRTVAPGSLPGFLRQHYTTSSDMAKTLSAYVLANGATDTRVANVPVNRQGRPDAQPGNPQGSAANQPAQGAANQSAEAPKPPPRRQQEAARSDADGLVPPAEPKPPRAVQQQAARTPEAGSPKPPLRNVKRGAEPPTAEEKAAQVAAREAEAKNVTGEAAISSAVPLPEPAGLPPPTAADFAAVNPNRIEIKPADSKPNGPVASSVPSPSPPPTPQRSSSASLAPRPAGSPPAPPISH